MATISISPERFQAERALEIHKTNWAGGKRGQTDSQYLLWPSYLWLEYNTNHRILNEEDSNVSILRLLDLESWWRKKGLVLRKAIKDAWGGLLRLKREETIDREAALAKMWHQRGRWWWIQKKLQIQN